MLNQSTFTGFTFNSSTWAIDSGSSYPYLSVFYPGSTQAVFITSPVAAATQGTLVDNGTIVNTSSANAAGTFYFLGGNNVITGVNSSLTSTGDLLAFISSGSTLGNVVAPVPTSGGSYSITSAPSHYGSQCDKYVGQH